MVTEPQLIMYHLNKLSTGQETMKVTYTSQEKIKESNSQEQNKNYISAKN